MVKPPKPLSIPSDTQTVVSGRIHLDNSLFNQFSQCRRCPIGVFLETRLSSRTPRDFTAGNKLARHGFQISLYLPFISFHLRADEQVQCR